MDLLNVKGDVGWCADQCYLSLANHLCQTRHDSRKSQLHQY